VEKVISDLNNAHYKVSALGVKTTSRLRVPTVVYYHREDETQARDLIKLLKQVGVQKIREEPAKTRRISSPKAFRCMAPEN
jgi:hypothetical protein